MEFGKIPKSQIVEPLLTLVVGWTQPFVTRTARKIFNQMLELMPECQQRIPSDCEHRDKKLRTAVSLTGRQKPIIIARQPASQARRWLRTVLNKGPFSINIILPAEEVEKIEKTVRKVSH